MAGALSPPASSVAGVNDRQLAPPDGFVAVVKEDCPTCVEVAPVLGDLAARLPLAVYSQDNPAFPNGADPIDDSSLEFSWHNNIETVPTLIKVEDGTETDRIVGWDRDTWSSFTGLDDLAATERDFSPGCGSLSVDPNLVDELAVRFGSSILRTRRVAFAELEDEIEAMYDRGWSDGLPLVPPTEARVMAMLAGTTKVSFCK